MTGQAPILKGLLDLWCLDKVHIAAHDIGGEIAQHFAIFSTESYVVDTG